MTLKSHSKFTQLHTSYEKPNLPIPIPNPKLPFGVIPVAVSGEKKYKSTKIKF